MKLESDNALATITFGGLLVFRFNRHKYVELDFLSCKNHSLSLKIWIRLPGVPPLPIKHSISCHKEIRIEAVNPVSAGCSPYFGTDPFCRRDAQGDVNDIRWIFDLEGPELHKKRLDTLPSTPGSTAKLFPRVLLTSGTLYAKDLPDDQFMRERYSDKKYPVFLGKAADIIGVDITCEDEGNSSVVINNPGFPGSLLKLPKFGRVRYLVEFDNRCAIGRNKHSDFTLYYKVLRDPGGQKFDLRRCVPDGAPGATGLPFPGSGLFAPDDRPQKCSGVALSMPKPKSHS